MKKMAAIALLFILGTFSMAQVQQGVVSATPQSAPTGFRKEFLNNYDTLFKKVIDLATKMPEDKYDWRPEEGVRSIGEVYLHIGIANYGFARSFGAKFPTDIDLRTLEKSKPGKAKTIEFLKRSDEYVRGLILALPDADFEKSVTLFGQQTTIRGAIVFMGMHHSEHLGQSIAYARVAGIVPPWSEDGKKK